MTTTWERAMLRATEKKIVRREIDRLFRDDEILRDVMAEMVVQEREQNRARARSPRWAMRRRANPIKRGKRT